MLAGDVKSCKSSEASYLSIRVGLPRVQDGRVVNPLDITRLEGVGEVEGGILRQGQDGPDGLLLKCGFCVAVFVMIIRG